MFSTLYSLSYTNCHPWDPLSVSFNPPPPPPRRPPSLPLRSLRDHPPGVSAPSLCWCSLLALALHSPPSSAPSTFPPSLPLWPPPLFFFGVGPLVGVEWREDGTGPLVGVEWREDGTRSSSSLHEAGSPRGRPAPPLRRQWRCSRGKILYLLGWALLEVSAPEFLKIRGHGVRVAAPGHIRRGLGAAATQAAVWKHRLSCVDLRTPVDADEDVAVPHDCAGGEAPRAPSWSARSPMTPVTSPPRRPLFSTGTAFFSPLHRHRSAAGSLAWHVTRGCRVIGACGQGKQGGAEQNAVSSSAELRRAGAPVELRAPSPPLLRTTVYGGARHKHVGGLQAQRPGAASPTSRVPTATIGGRPRQASCATRTTTTATRGCGRARHRQIELGGEPGRERLGQRRIAAKADAGGWVRHVGAGGRRERKEWAPRELAPTSLN
jgi:hypothetical protein